MVVPQKLADPRARARPHFRPQRHERVELRRGEHCGLDDIEPAVLRELPEIEHVIADGDTDARGEPVLGGEYAVGEVLDREGGSGRDVDEGAEFGVVGMGHNVVLLVSRQTLTAVIPGWSEGPDPESRDSG